MTQGLTEIASRSTAPPTTAPTEHEALDREFDLDSNQSERAARRSLLGEVLDWLLKQAGELATLAWRETMDALQLLGRSVREALDWAKAKSAAVLRKVIEAAEAAGALVGGARSQHRRAVGHTGQAGGGLLRAGLGLGERGMRRAQGRGRDQKGGGEGFHPRGTCKVMVLF